jgi:hypothetical protein
LGQPRPRLAAEGEADGAVGCGQPGTGAGMDIEQLGKAFAEDGLWASGIEAAEAANEEA